MHWDAGSTTSRVSHSSGGMVVVAVNANPACSGRPSQGCPQPGHAQHPPRSPVSQWQECVDSCGRGPLMSRGSDISHRLGSVTQLRGSSSCSSTPSWSAKQPGDSPPLCLGHGGFGCSVYNTSSHCIASGVQQHNISGIINVVVVVAVNANHSLL